MYIDFMFKLITFVFVILVNKRKNFVFQLFCFDISTSI